MKLFFAVTSRFFLNWQIVPYLQRWSKGLVIQAGNFVLASLRCKQVSDATMTEFVFSHLYNTILCICNELKRSAGEKRGQQEYSQLQKQQSPLGQFHAFCLDFAPPALHSVKGGANTTWALLNLKKMNYDVSVMRRYSRNILQWSKIKTKSTKLTQWRLLKFV